MNIDLNNLPIFLTFTPIKKSFEEIIKTFNIVILIKNDKIYISKDVIFPDLENIFQFLYILSEKIINNNISDYISNSVSLVYEIKENILSYITQLNELKIRVQEIQKNIISAIMYSNDKINNIKNYYSIDKSLYSQIEKYYIELNNISIKLYFLTLYFCNIFLEKDKVQLNNKNNLLFNFIKLLSSNQNIDEGLIVDNIIKHYDEYINMEFYIQFMIKEFIFKNKNDFDKYTNIVSEFIYFYFSDIMYFENKLYIQRYINLYFTKFIADIENIYFSNTNIVSLINDKTISDHCDVKLIDIKNFGNIVIKNYINKLSNNDYYNDIIRKLNNEIFNKCKSKPLYPELINMINNYSNDFNDIFLKYTVNNIINDPFYFSDISPFFYQLYTISMKLYIEDKNFFKYIFLIKEIVNYKKESINNNYLLNELYIKLNELLYKCVDYIKVNYYEFYNILKIMESRLLQSCYKNILDFIIFFYEYIIDKNIKIDVENLEINDINNINIFEEFEDTKDEYVENQAIAPYYSEINVNFYNNLYNELRLLNIYYKNGYISNFYGSCVIKGNLPMNLENYYYIPNKKISIKTFLRLNFGGNSKNIIILGEYHYDDLLNYSYIQNELYRIKQKNIESVDFLVENVIHNFYLGPKKIFSNYYDLISLFKYSPCLRDKKIKNVYYDPSINTIDNIFCFDNIWYENIDYRISDYMLGYTFNNGFTKIAKEKIIILNNLNNTVESICLKYFMQQNNMLITNTVLQDYIDSENMLIEIFGNTHKYYNPLFQTIEQSIDLNKLKFLFKNIISSASAKLNETITKNQKEIDEYYEYYLNINVEKSLLYDTLKSKKVTPIFTSEMKYMNDVIDNITHEDLYRTLLLHIFNVYNYLYYKYENVRNINDFLLSNDFNIFTYRSFKFLKKTSDNLDNNIILNIITSFFYITETSDIIIYKELIYYFVHYTNVFSKMYLYLDIFPLSIIDCFIDINTIYKLFFKFNVKSRLESNFPESSKNTIVYIGDAHLKILLYYLNNPDGKLIYRKQNKSYINPYINENQYFLLSNNTLENVLIPSIVNNII